MGSSSGSRNEEDACIDAMLFSTSFVLPMVLNAAVELDRFGIIAEEGPGAYVSAAKIASRLATPNPEAPALLDRMLCLFASQSLLSYSLQTVDGRVERVYGLTSACKFFIGCKDEGSVCSFLALAHHRATTEVWLNMKDVILDGGSLFERVHGMYIFEYMKKDQEFNTIFNEAMAGLSTMTMNAILKNIYEEPPAGGKLIIMNAIMREEPVSTKKSQYVSRLDNTMLTQPAEKERTAQEYRNLTESAGFSDFTVVCVARGIWAVMESYK